MQPDDPDQTPTAPAGAPQPAGPRRLHRSRSDRVIGGVAGGLAEYFGIDPIITRLAFAALAFAGGAGILLYIAAMLLVPEEGAGGAPTPRNSGRTATVAGVLVLLVAAGVLLNGGWWWSSGGGAVAWILAVALIGLGVWWLASGESPAGSGPEVLRRIGLGLAVLALCCVLAAGAFWGAAAGGGAVVAGILIAAGAVMVVASFAGGARWLILPALAVALPATLVAAAGIDARGGVGERTYRPVSATQLADGYKLGMARMIVDLRHANLPAGDRRLQLRLGVGEAVVVVPRDVCVAVTARVGAGEVRLFDHSQAGADLDVDERPPAPPGTTRLLVDAHLGLAQLQVRHTWPARGDWHTHEPADAPGNAACTGGTA